MQKLEDLILLEAKRAGFAGAGIAKAGPAETFHRFASWLGVDRHAGMEYLRRNAALREDPRRLLPEVKAILVVAARYPVNRDPGRGISTYARGADYHEVIRKKLEGIARVIEQAKGKIRRRICVDSAPVLEREWALRAGIGWQGRQGQIVSRETGCCILLGELMLDVDLMPSQPVENMCGDCRLCIESCPTGALSGDGPVDARKCISYLTIEHEGEIDAGLCGKMGQSLFGCDICTAICPWNRHGEGLVMDELRENNNPTAEECLAMTDETFRQVFANTAVLRSGLNRLRRNAGIAVNNTGSGQEYSNNQFG